jgi:pheromone a factor receptor
VLAKHVQCHSCVSSGIHLGPRPEPHHCCVQLCVGFSPSLCVNFLSYPTLGLNIRIFWKSSQQLNGLLLSNKSPHQNRYIRLIALSSTQVLFTLPLSLYILYFNSATYPIDPWVSWAVTHLDYSRIDQYPSIIWRADPTVGNVLEINRWLVVLSAFLFFAFFGFAEEARKHYRLAYTFAASRLRLSGLSISRASGMSPRSFTSSFGPGLRKGRADVFGSPLSSHNQPGTVKERDTPSLVSDHRLTSDSSVFGDTDDEPKPIGFLADEDDSRSVPAAVQTAVVVLPTVSRVPVPPLPIADGARLSFPPDRLNSPLPHRPMSSYLDLCENV